MKVTIQLGQIVTSVGVGFNGHERSRKHKTASREFAPDCRSMLYSVA